MFSKLFKDSPVNAELIEVRQHYRKILDESNRVFKDAFESGTDADSLVRDRVSLIDELMMSIWQCCIQHHIQNTESIALVAVGGYGRGELHPYSDIDILILLDDSQSDGHNSVIEEFITLLWDLGLDIGQSVRTVRQCHDESEKDVTVITNLIEARLIWGPHELFDKMREAIRPEAIWPSDKFFAAKLEEQNARHSKFHDTAYNLEPNIKENPGGLRDLQMIGWVTKRHFNTNTLYELVHHKFLTQKEYDELMSHQSFLWKVRMALHYTAGRREDRLLFDYQKPLANLFGYKDTEHKLGVELFMRDYYITVMELNRLNEMLLQLFQEAILLADSDHKPTEINERFQAINGYLDAKHDDVFKSYPPALLEVFLLMEQHQELKGVRAATIRLIRENSHLINEEYRNDSNARALFIAIMRQPRGLTHELRRMNRYGILAKYLPAFNNIVGQMQYDLFHVYTVDEHTLFVVRNLRRMMIDEFKDELPHCHTVIKNIKKPEILYLAGLFHDIAKGRGGDHSELGADDARKFCLDHGMSEQDTEQVVWLVKNHLVMSRTSQREDISDPEVILNFAEFVSNTTRLSYLYLLTVADMRGTSPDVWSSWKGNLLINLYESTKDALRRDSGISYSKTEQIKETKSHSRNILLAQEVDLHDLDSLWDTMSDDYFLRYTADDIAWQTSEILQHKNPSEPLVLIRINDADCISDVFIYTRGSSKLFMIISATLDQLGLNTVDARVITSKIGYACDMFMVTEKDDTPITGGMRIYEVKKALYENLKAGNIPNTYTYLHRPRQHKHFETPTTLKFDHDIHGASTAMELRTTDRPGLLADVGLALEQLNMNILNARVSTFGNRAEDIFYITTQEGSPLSDREEQVLQDLLIEKLD